MKNTPLKSLKQYKNMIALTPPSDYLNSSTDLLMDIVKAAGFSNIEIPCDVSDVKNFIKTVRLRGVKISSVHGTLGYDAASLSKTKRRKAVEFEIGRMKSVKACASCPYVVHYLNRFNDKKRGIAYKKSVEELLDAAVKSGLFLSIETAPYKPEEDERYADSKEIAGFVRSLNSPDIGICIDVNHSNLKENLKDVIENCRGLISNVHISDNCGKKENHLPLGHGIIQFAPFLKSLFNSGYAGYLTIEVSTIRIVETMLADNREFLENVILKTGFYKKEKHRSEHK